MDRAAAALESAQEKGAAAVQTAQDKGAAAVEGGRQAAEGAAQAAAEAAPDLGEWRGRSSAMILKPVLHVVLRQAVIRQVACVQSCLLPL